MKNDKKSQQRQVDITEQLVRCCDEILLSEDSAGFTYELWFDTDLYFGKQTKDMDNVWINFYTEFHKDGQVTAFYEVSFPDHTEMEDWELTAKEQLFFYRMMEEYCKQKYYCSLRQLGSEFWGDDLLDELTDDLLQRYRKERPDVKLDAGNAAMIRENLEAVFWQQGQTAAAEYAHSGMLLW